MALYIPGIQTREKILSEAKRLFYQKGISDTSLQEITKSLGIKQSLLYHYYKNKDEICAEIYAALNNDIDYIMLSEIKKQDLKIDKTTERCLMVAIFYNTILNDPNLVRFVSDLRIDEIQMHSEFIRQKYQELIDENPQCLEYTSLDFIMLENVSFHFRLSALLERNEVNYSKEVIVRYFIRHILRSLYVDNEAITEIVDEVYKLALRFTFSVDEQFNVSVMK